MVVVEHRRAAELGRIVEGLEAAIDERLGLERAEIVSANELSDQQKREIEDALATTRGKRIRPIYQIDPAIVGGNRAPRFEGIRRFATRQASGNAPPPCSNPRSVVVFDSMWRLQLEE